MFYKIEVNDHIRIPPKLFGIPTKDAVMKRVRKKYEGFISKDYGIIIDVVDVKKIGDGIVISGDGASYFDATFELFTFRPEMHEVVIGSIRDIADFGAFINLGPIEGMIHVSQTMDDFVSFSKDKVLLGKETKRVLKVNDKCKAKIIAVSYKDISNPKLGLTMRQPFIGKYDWIEEDVAKKQGKPVDKKETKKEKK